MTTMNGLVLGEVRNFDSLQLKPVTLPTLEPSEVRVQIKAAALNHRDLWIVQGLYAKIKLPVILGSDGSGVVVEVGEKVDKAWAGKSVIINPALDWGNDPLAQQAQFRILGMPGNGTQADYVVVPATNIHIMPSHLSFEEAAALPLAGLTAYRALFTQGKLGPGEVILITGIGGGVAAMAMQLALALGNKVYVTSGDEHKIQKAKIGGAIAGVNYHDKNWASVLGDLSNHSGFDLVVDSAGGPGFNLLLDLVKPGGKVIIFGATAGNPSDLNLRKIFWKQIRIQGTTMGTPDDFQNMLQFVKEHQIKPIIHAVYAISDYEKAYQDMMKGRQFGKIVLKGAE